MSLVYRLVRSPRGVVGAALFLVLAFAAAVGPSLVPYNPALQNLNLPVQAPTLVGANGAAHLLGTDQLGRDILSRLLVGLRVSLVVSFVVVPLSVVLGIASGVVAGYAGGTLDLLLMRIVDVQLAVPTLLFMIAVVAVLGSGLVQIVVLLAIAGWPTYARIVRADVLSLKEREFLAAARATGCTDIRILTSHVLPNVVSTITILATLQLPVVIVWESTLSFLGLGIQPPTPSLGQMLSDAQSYIWQAWWLPAIPGVAITLIVLALNLLGDRLRDVLDPRLRSTL